MKLDAAWEILRQFVEPELQVLAGQEGTAEVWTALRTVESALKLPPKLPRPRGWATTEKKVAVVEKTVTVSKSTKKVAAKSNSSKKKPAKVKTKVKK